MDNKAMRVVRTWRPPAAGMMLSILVFAVAAPAWAEQEGASSPREAVGGYLEACRAGDYAGAAAFLDLGGLSPAVRSTRGPDLARQMKTVLDRALWVDLEQMSDAADGDPDDGLPRGRDLVGRIETAKGPVPIYVEQTGPKQRRIWQISGATVARIPELLDEFGYGPLGEYLPPWLFETRLLDVQLWQWIGLLTLAVVAGALSWVAAAGVLWIARPLIRRSRTEVDDHLLAATVGPLQLLAGVMLFAAGVYPLGLAVPVQVFFTSAEKALVIIALTWGLARLVDLVARGVEERLVARGQALAMSVVPLGRRTVKAVVIAIATLAVLQNFGVNVTGILAGLGIGGLAIALAAQKTVENLFGGITLIADQPVRVGDFCRFGDRLGTVEEVGLRSTRVRTLDRTVVTVPNAEFSGMQLENFARRDHIWFRTTVGLRYETTPDQLRYVLVELKKLLVSHPRVHSDPARVRFVGFGAYSLDVEIFAYILTSDINEFLAVQEDLLLRIMDLVAVSGTGFAFPSQTIYTAKDTGLDTERGRTAEDQVREWRERNALGLPHFSPEQVGRLAGTLEYPPRGSTTPG